MAVCCPITTFSQKETIMNPKDDWKKYRESEYWYQGEDFEDDGVFENDVDEDVKTKDYDDILDTVNKLKAEILARHLGTSPITVQHMSAASISYSQPSTPVSISLYDDDEGRLILERLSEMTFEHLASMSPWDHLSIEDAGGKYMMEVLNEFRIYVKIFLQRDNSVDNLLYMEAKDEALYRLLDRMDEADKYDVLMSFYGDEEAESIEPDDFSLRFDKLVSSIVRPLWRYLRAEVS